MSEHIRILRTYGVRGYVLWAICGWHEKSRGRIITEKANR